MEIVGAPEDAIERRARPDVQRSRRIQIVHCDGQGKRSDRGRDAADRFDGAASTVSAAPTGRGAGGYSIIQPIIRFEQRQPGGKRPAISPHGQWNFDVPLRVRSNLNRLNL